MTREGYLGLVGFQRVFQDGVKDVSDHLLLLGYHIQYAIRCSVPSSCTTCPSAASS